MSDDKLALALTAMLAAQKAYEYIRAIVTEVPPALVRRVAQDHQIDGAAVSVALGYAESLRGELPATVRITRPRGGV